MSDMPNTYQPSTAMMVVLPLFDLRFRHFLISIIHPAYCLDAGL